LIGEQIRALQETNTLKILGQGGYIVWGRMKGSQESASWTASQIQILKMGSTAPRPLKRKAQDAGNEFPNRGIAQGRKHVSKHHSMTQRFQRRSA
jgi:hypothetical protein